jgi:hypothetical protein
MSGRDAENILQPIIKVGKKEQGRPRVKLDPWDSYMLQRLASLRQTKTQWCVE